jgi:hypothetical protein
MIAGLLWDSSIMIALDSSTITAMSGLLMAVASVIWSLRRKS